MTAEPIATASALAPDSPPVAGSRGARSVEVVLADLERVAGELVAVAGPDALDALDQVGGIVMSRLVTASARVRVLVHRLETLRLSFLPRIEADGRWAAGSGARTFATWLALTQNIALATARREVHTAQVLDESLPATRTDALAGRIGADHVRALVSGAPTSPARRAALADPVSGEAGPVPGDAGPLSSDARPGAGLSGEEFLLAHARQHRPAQFRRLVARFAQVTDPDADERGYSHAKDREHLELARTFGGYHLSGFLTEEHGLTLTAALSSIMGAPTPGDGRTTTQRRAQALTSLARITLDNSHTGTGAAVRPHLTVTVSWTELTALAARAAGETPASSAPAGSGLLARGGATFTESGTLVSAGLLAKIACDSQVTRVVFGPDSQILDVGRSRRTIPHQLRRAVIARDRHCTYPGCDEPPSRCEVHHAVRHWADGGTTSVSNSALLCWHHHDHVDTRHITMRRHGSAWTFTDRHGRPLDPPATSP